MKKVLVVDDNEINAILVSEMLGECGVSADVADSGVQAMASVKECDYRFILMDYIMPGMNGIEATSEIIKIRPDAVIYAMTGDINDELLNRFKEAGALGAVSKPLNPEEIVSVVVKHLPVGTYHLPGGFVKKDSDDEIAGIKLKSMISDIPGLNYEKGLSNALGGIKSYLRILKASIGNIRQYIDILSEYQPGMEVSKLKLSFHSLKSVFGNIGMEVMRNQADSMELIVNRILAEGDSTDDSRNRMESELGSFIETASDAADRLESVINEFDSETAQTDTRCYERPEQKLTDEEYAEVRQFVSDVLGACEIDRITQGLEILIKASTGDVRRSLEQALRLADEFDYDGIRAILDELFKTEE